jgi:hypothetical protein
VRSDKIDQKDEIGKIHPADHPNRSADQTRARSAAMAWACTRRPRS